MSSKFINTESQYGHNLKDSIPFILFLVLLSVSAFAIPPSETVSNITSVVAETGVPIGETFGVRLKVVDGAGAGVPNHYCQLGIQEWRDNVSYAFKKYEIEPECLEGFAFTGESTSGTDDIPDVCFYQTNPAGGIGFVVPVTYEEGFNVAPPTGSYVGGYGTYRWIVQCGNTADLYEAGNFTVYGHSEPTEIMDYARLPSEYPAHFAGLLFMIILVAIGIYYLKELLF